MTTTRELVSVIPQVGRLDDIGITPVRRGEVLARSEVNASVEEGLEEDRRTSGKRQVTLIQAEHLPVIASIQGLPELRVQKTRRNLAIRGINVYALRNQRFRVGDVLLEGTGLAHPCSRMEQDLGAGGFAAMRGMGGITAKILEGGTLRIGDSVRLVPHNDPLPDEDAP
jgi:MOSC domain-containing protein YiiM